MDNDATLANLGKQAVIAAAAAEQILRRPPRQWMDKSVLSAVALDAAGFTGYGYNVPFTKFAFFYGPFREAAGTALKGDRKTYQMNPMNRREAIRESLLDEACGADCLMVKPDRRVARTCCVKSANAQRLPLGATV